MDTFPLPRHSGEGLPMIKDAPMPLKILLSFLLVGIIALVLYGVIGENDLAFKLAVADMILFGGVLTIWRVKSKGADHG